MGWLSTKGAWNVNTLGRIWRLLHFENVVEVKLQFLVAEVDAQLLEAVHLEGLETEDIQHTDEFVAIFAVCGKLLVNTINYPRKRSP